VIVVASLPDRPLFHLRRLCQRLRSRFVGVPIIVAAWGAKDRDRARQQLPGLVDGVFVSFSETRKYLAQLPAQSAPSEANVGGTNPLPVSPALFGTAS
jgi:hypothetical protein